MGVGKNEKEVRHKYETLAKRSEDFNGDCLGPENISNIVALVVGQWTQVAVFLLCRVQKKKPTRSTLSCAVVLSVMVITPTIFYNLFIIFSSPAPLGEQADFINKGFCDFRVDGSAE